MIGKRKDEVTLFDVGNVWDFAPNPKSFYGQLALVSDKLFADEDFVALYSDKRGRPSVPPSLLALVLMLQTYEGLSDEDAIEHTACDLNWAAVLRRHAGTPLCAKSTLQLFRAHLLLHEAHRLLLQRSLTEARKKGLLKGQHLTAVVDTKPILGRGAVEDTYNLLGTAMKQLSRAIAQDRKELLPVFLMRHNFPRLKEPSIKGSFEVDWSDQAAREGVLTQIVSDARRLLAMADGSKPAIKKAADLLEKLLLQDVSEEPSDEGRPLARLKKGTTQGRIPSATDPQQRHGHKSKSKHFTGSKASVAVDADTGLFLATDVLSGDAGDAKDVLWLVEQGQINAEANVDETLADCAYGDGATRKLFIDAGKKLFAKVPAESPNKGFFPKSQFRLDLPISGQSLEETKITCPGGHVANRLTPNANRGITFYFDEFCGGCSLRSQCTQSKYGRSVRIHYQEPILQEARKFQATPEGRTKLRRRLVVENGLARLAQLGIGQARYIGRMKTAFQLTIAATVANLRRTWNWNQSPKPGDGLTVYTAAA